MFRGQLRSCLYRVMCAGSVWQLTAIIAILSSFVYRKKSPLYIVYIRETTSLCNHFPYINHTTCVFYDEWATYGGTSSCVKTWISKALRTFWLQHKYILRGQSVSLYSSTWQCGLTACAHCSVPINTKPFSENKLGTRGLDGMDLCVGLFTDAVTISIHPPREKVQLFLTGFILLPPSVMSTAEEDIFSLDLNP